MSIPTFTIGFNQTPQYAFFYPSGNQFKQLAAYGDTDNYLCVDDVKGVPDTSSFVSTASISISSDIYTLPNRSDEIGSIQWVEVNTRAKAESSPSPTYIYKILCSVSGSTYASDSQAILNNWNNYSIVSSSSPTDGSDWDWSDIDNLEIGVECSSPSNVAGAEKTQTLYPNESIVTYSDFVDACVKIGTPCPTCGDGSEWHHYLNETPYDVENRVETEPLYCGASLVTATIEFQDHTVDDTSFNITKVAVYYVSASYTDSAAHHIYVSMNNDPTQTQWHHEYCHTSWTLQSKEFTSQPSGSAWTWTAVNQIELGFRLEATQTYGSGFANAYIVVYYTGEDMDSPNIHTTQCYARVKYTPTNVNYYLNKPINIRKEIGRDTGAIEFWSEDREVFDINLANSTLIMEGFETGATGESRIDNIQDIMEYESSVSVSGLDEDRYDGSYFVQDFSFGMDASAPTIYRWNMVLEKA